MENDLKYLLDKIEMLQEECARYREIAARYRVALQLIEKGYVTTKSTAEIALHE